MSICTYTLYSGIVAYILECRYLELLFWAGASSCTSLCLDLLEAADEIGWRYTRFLTNLAIHGCLSS
jgi:hypothetical protein